MISIRSFNSFDLPFLEKLYPNMTSESILKMLSEWDTKCFNCSYFEMFAIECTKELVGMVSLYQYDAKSISCGPEILPEYRKNGFAFKAVSLALEHAKKLGFTTAIAEIRCDNAASIALHKKLGFTYIRKYINRKGNFVFSFSKEL